MNAMYFTSTRAYQLFDSRASAPAWNTMPGAGSTFIVGCETAVSIGFVTFAPAYNALEIIAHDQHVERWWK